MAENTNDREGMVTVAEWAEQHCRTDHTVTESVVQHHVAAVILAMVFRNRSPWNVGVDGDGRVSLIWVSLPAVAWEMLYVEGTRITTIRGQA